MSAPQPGRYDGRPRLLSRQAANLSEHARADGPLPLNAVPQLVDMVGAAGLRGRGGAWFPTGRKLASVAKKGQGAYVIVNGVESEPAAGKDKLLLSRAPHLVLDGAELAALAVGAKNVTVCVHRGNGLARLLAAAIDERAVAGWSGGVALDVREPPRWYVSSESTALANFVNGGEGKPRDVPTYRSGVGGKPTLVSNAETFAHIALIARYGPGWFRMAGTGPAPGTALFTVSGGVRRPGVYELPVGVAGEHILRAAGGPVESIGGLLLGGYGGSWVMPDDVRRPFTPEGLEPVNASPGAGVVIALPVSACGLGETVRVTAWLASQNARQCGPCFNGLPAIADDLARLTWGGDRRAFDRLRFRLGIVNGRGGCAHPDGVVRLVQTALRVFAQDVQRHLAGRPCPGVNRPRVLPIPAPPHVSEGWR